MAGGRTRKAKPAVTVPTSRELLKTFAQVEMKKSPKKGGTDGNEISSKNRSKLSLKDYEFYDESPTKESTSLEKKKSAASPARNLKQTPKRPTNVDSSDSSLNSDDEDQLRNVSPLKSKKGTPSPSKTESVRRNQNPEFPKTSNDAEDSGNTSYESLDEEEDDGENYVNVPKKNPIIVPNPAKLEDIRKGNEIAMSFPHEDLQMFIATMKEACDVLDRQKASQRALHFDWNSVAFKNYSGDDLRITWMYLQNKRRASRNMWEYVNEIEYETKRSNYKSKWIKSHPDYPAKPPGSGGALAMYAHKQYVASKKKSTEPINYMKFYKGCIQEFNNLGPSEKLKYLEMSNTVAKDFEKKLAEFYESVGYNPEILAKKKRSRSRSAAGFSSAGGSSWKQTDTYADAPIPPLSAMERFAASKIKKLDPPPLPEELDEIRIQYVSKFLKTKEPKQAKVINKVIEATDEYLKEVEEYKKIHPHYIVPKGGKLSNILNKREIQIWETYYANRPVKPPLTGIGIFEEELKENGQFRPEEYDSDVAAKQALESKFKSLSWYEKSAYNIKVLQVESEYCQAINKYYEELPPFLKPLILPTIDKKYRAPALVPDSPARSPKKRKPEMALAHENAAPAEKKSRKGKQIAEEVIAQAQAEEAAARETLETADTGSSSPEKKKKKKKHKHETVGALAAALRGIFDGRPLLGRRYTFLYHYTKRLSVSTTWIERIDKVGIMNTALLMLETYINLTDEEKFEHIKATLTLQSPGFLQIKEEAFLDSDAKPFFPCEPSPPHLDAKSLHNAEEKGRHKGGSKPAWTLATPEVKSFYIKKHYNMMKTYVKRFEDFVLSMTPHDLALYTAAKASEWERKNETVKRIKGSSDVLPIVDFDPLDKNLDGCNDKLPPLLSHGRELALHGQPQRKHPRVSKSVFDNSLFLDQLYNT